MVLVMIVMHQDKKPCINGLLFPNFSTSVVPRMTRCIIYKGLYLAVTPTVYIESASI